MYSELKAELIRSIAELNKFDTKNPFLELVTIFPEDYVLQVFNQLHTEYNKERLDRIRYLHEATERPGGVVVGSVHDPADSFTIDTTEKHIDNELKTLKAELLSTLHLATLEIKALYLRIEQRTATYTAELVDKRYILQENIVRAHSAIADYYISYCHLPSMAHDLELVFHTNKDTLPEGSGIYFICSEGEIMYIGHSKHIKERVGNHELGQMYYCENELECVTSELEINKAIDVEAELIYIFKPKENTYSKS